MVKKAFWILIAIAILGYLANNYFENRAREEAKRVAALEKENAIKAAVAKMATSTNAKDDWDEKLSKGEMYRLANILTVELEELWIGDRPILFAGSIDDISTIDENKYRVIISRNIFSSLKRHMFSTDLLLDLQCDRAMVDPIIKSHPELFKDLGWNKGVAVVAKINSIRTDYRMDEEGGKREIRIGQGSCVDIVFTGRVAI